MRLVTAHQQFITEVHAAVRDASLAALERAFADALAPRLRLNAPHDDTPAAADTASAPPPTAMAVSMTAADRVLTCIREAPGSNIAQLSRSLEMRASTVRRHLRQLWGEDAIRIEGTHDSRFGGQMQTFFAREPGSISAVAREPSSTSAVAREPGSISAEVSAIAVEASA